MFLFQKKFCFVNTKKFFCGIKSLRAARKKIKIAKRGENLFLLFIYDEKLVQEILSNPEVLSYLNLKGYFTDKGISNVLNELLNRLSYCESFPHEIGVFLGYPLEDVVGYEKYSGTKTKFSGAWAVYGNVDEAVKKMELYKKCSVFCSSLFEAGNNFEAICKTINFM
ncbi:MAG TPA: DUF3793 domain-containing protein [Treponema sp.]|nr:DUF3793 domain-containing protein [Treponema sp.]